MHCIIFRFHWSPRLIVIYEEHELRFVWFCIYRKIYADSRVFCRILSKYKYMYFDNSSHLDWGNHIVQDLMSQHKKKSDYNVLCNTLNNGAGVHSLLIQFPDHAPCQEWFGSKTGKFDWGHWIYKDFKILSPVSLKSIPWRFKCPSKLRTNMCHKGFPFPSRAKFSRVFTYKSGPRKRISHSWYDLLLNKMTEVFFDKIKWMCWGEPLWVRV